MNIKGLSRRNFMKYAGSLAGALGAVVIVGPVLAYFFPKKLEEVPSEPVPVGAPDSLPVGESRTVRFGRYPALVLNTEDGLRAYSAVCTHFACIVKWDAELGQIVCPCHEGFFSAENGHVISGPPPTPLKTLPVYIEDDQIFIGGAS